MSTPMAQPPIAILSEEKMCWGKVAPSGAVEVIFLIKVAAMVTGPGKVELFVIFSTSQHHHQMAIKANIETMDNHR